MSQRKYVYKSVVYFIVLQIQTNTIFGVIHTKTIGPNSAAAYLPCTI